MGFKKVNQASSVIDLDKLLRNDYGAIITTTLQKFQETDKEATTYSAQTELEERGNLMVEKHLGVGKERNSSFWVGIESHRNCF